MLIRLIKTMASGAVRFWQVELNGTEVTTSYGFVGNDESIKTNVKEIEAGKNIGKITETTAEEEATREAYRLATSKVNAGYEFDESEDAEGRYDTLIEYVNAIIERVEGAKDEREAERVRAIEERAEERRLAKEARDAELAQAASKSEEEDEDLDEDLDEDEEENDLDENDEMDDDHIDA